MAGSELRFEMKIDRRAMDFFQREAPHKLTEAKEKAVEAMGMVWADEAKSITDEENHIDTSLYINSIGYSTGTPSDPIWDIDQRGSKTVLTAGADVPYAKHLERRYGIMSRGLDRGEARMKRVAETQIRNTLSL